MKFLKKIFCKHQGLELAIEKGGLDVEKDYFAICAECQRQIEIKVIFWSMGQFSPSFDRNCKKVGYKNKKDAETIFNYCKSQHRKRRVARIYLCLNCKNWHLTSKNKSS